MYALSDTTQADRNAYPAQTSAHSANNAVVPPCATPVRSVGQELSVRCVQLDTLPKLAQSATRDTSRTLTSVKAVY